MKPKATLPTVSLTRAVLENIFDAALKHPDSETGEAIVGIAAPPSKSGISRMFILNTIPPMQDAVRQWAMFEQGDDWQGAVFNWWYENWEMYRELRRSSYGNAVMAKWDMPLQHLGDWHKQPDGMIAPSGGDMRTARHLMKELELEFLLMPIVTFEESRAPLTTANTLAIATSERRIRIDFWWVSQGNTRFEPVHPVLESNGGIPRLPDIVWWLKDQEHFDAELSALEKEGLQVMDIISWSENGRPPLDTYFIIYRPGSHRVWIAITALDYPHSRPEWRTAPILRPEDDEDFFTALYATSKPVPKAALTEWTPKTRLVDAIKMINEWEKQHA